MMVLEGKQSQRFLKIRGHMTVKQIIDIWEKEIAKNDRNYLKFPEGIYFFEGDTTDIRAFKTFMLKYNIPKSEYYIVKDAVYFR